MNFYIDITNKKLRASATSSQVVSNPTFTKGDYEPINIFLMEDNGTDTYDIKTLSSSDSIKVAIGTHADGGVYAYSNTFTLAEDGNSVNMDLSLNTTEMNTAIGTSDTLSAFLEVEYTSGATITTVLKTACTINNELIEDNVATDELPSATSILQAAAEVEAALAVVSLVTEVEDLTSTSITIAEVQANTVYNYGTLSSLTFTTVENSIYESVIFFSSGDTATTFTYPSSLGVIGSTSISANTSYVISICNNVMVMGAIN